MDEKLLRKTTIGRDFLYHLEMKFEQPDVDAFLDYRSSLVKNIYAKSEPIKREIKAVDEIINYLTKQTNDTSNNNKYK